MLRTHAALWQRMELHCLLSFRLHTLLLEGCHRSGASVGTCLPCLLCVRQVQPALRQGASVPLLPLRHPTVLFKSVH